jgi:SAM-dependent methyltransferase
MPDPVTTEQRSLAHWAEHGRAGMEAFYALAVEDYRRMVAARDWAADLRGHAVEGRVRVLDVACGSGKFPAELARRGLADAVEGTRVEVDLLDPSTFSLAEARGVLEAPFTVRAEHAVRIQDLATGVGGFDVAWATHALYAVPPDEIGAGIARMVAALRPGGFGAIVHATSASHYLRFASAFRTTFAPDSVPFTGAGQIRAALAAAGVVPAVTTMRYDVGHADRAVVEGFLQRCVFDDSVPLDRMEDEGAVGAYLSGCVDGDGDGYRFTQVVDVITWEAGVRA